jgi:nicotinamide-nucleotide amidase
MNAIILSVGDELILGQTVDTNSAWLAQQLAAIGIPTLAHITVPDDQPAIEQAIREAAERANLILISGGIGPTEDDLTRQALAAVMNVPLELNETWLKKLESFFQKLGRVMPPTNRIQAMIPRGAEMIDNSAGTAAGIRAQLLPGCRVFVMPGVPKEMKIMFARSVLPEIERESGGGVILSKTLHTFGAGESTVAEKLGPLMKRDRNPSVGTTVANGIVSLRINARFSAKAQAQQELEATSAACVLPLGDLIFGADHDTLPSIVADLLKRAKKTVTTAESCTGGLLAKYFTDLSGASDYFKQGWITYADDAKMSLLGVSAQMLQQHGAVSEQVASAMATGAIQRAATDFALSITGIAGPTGGTESKPVGTVCIALSTNAKPRASALGPHIKARTFLFTGDRETIRDRSAKMALTLLRYHLLEKVFPF